MRAAISAVYLNREFLLTAIPAAILTYTAAMVTKVPTIVSAYRKSIIWTAVVVIVVHDHRCRERQCRADFRIVRLLSLAAGDLHRTDPVRQIQETILTEKEWECEHHPSYRNQCQRSGCK